MKIEYKDFKIEVLGNKKEGFGYSVVRKNDNWILGEGYYECFNILKDCAEDVKVLVDDYYDNPEYFED